MLQWIAPQRTLEGKYRLLVRMSHWPDTIGLGADFNQEKDADLALQMIRAFEHTANEHKETPDGSITPQLEGTPDSEASISKHGSSEQHDPTSSRRNEDGIKEAK